jgi:glycerol-3-phosphate dehydrogenase (NAD(P)+)
MESYPGYPPRMARVAVFGAGAAGTAVAIHLARKGEDVTVWGSEYDARVLPDLMDRRVHPALPEALPDSLRVLGPEDLGEAAKEAEIAVMGANSRGARSLGEMVAPALGDATRFVVSVAKGLEDGTLQRMSEVYGETCGRPVVVLSGPSLAPEVAEGLLTGVAMASADPEALERATEVFRSPSFLVDPTDDVAGVEICGTAKNVAAIGAGILEGLAKYRQRDLKNARAALFTRAVHEIADLVESVGGRHETALGLAGMGDLLVTMLGGRNRIYGEALGLGSEPQHTLRDMEARGLTVEGAGSSQEVQALMDRAGLDLPIHRAVYVVVHEGAPPERVLEAVT